MLIYRSHLAICLFLFCGSFLWAKPPCGHNVEVTSPLILCPGDSLVLDVSAQGFPKVTWHDASFNVLDSGQTFVITQPGRYQVFSPESCFPTWIYIESPSTFYVPEWTEMTLCEGDEFQLYAGFHNANIQWHNGASGPFLVAQGSGTYSYTATFPCGTISNSIEINRVPRPELPFDDHIQFCRGTEISLDAQNLGLSHTWSNERTDDIATFSESGEEFLVVRSENCRTVLPFVLEAVDCDCPLSVPTFLTLNGDGKNDELRFTADCNFQKWSLRIFDMNGRLVFRSNDPQAQWPSASEALSIRAGVYAWVLEYQTAYEGENIASHKRGKVLVMR